MLSSKVVLLHLAGSVLTGGFSQVALCLKEGGCGVGYSYNILLVSGSGLFETFID